MKKQRGALTFITPMVMVVIIMLGVLAMDGARLYSLRQEMQSVANLAATAAVNAVQTCNGRFIDLNTSSGPANLDAVADEVVKDDIERLGGGLTLVQSGIVDAGSDNTYKFRPVSDDYASNAVRVVYEIKEEPISSLFPGAFGGVNLKASSVAKKEVVAAISAAGSTAIIGGTSDNAGLLGSLLGGLLGVQDYTLDATRIESLASTTFALGGFLDSIGVSSGLTAVDDLVGVDQVLRGVLAGLDGGGDAASVIQGVLSDSGLVNTNLRLNEVISLISDVQYPEQAQVPVYDTVVALALNLASGVVRIPLDVDLSIGDALDVQLDLLVDEPPTVAVGPARIDSNGMPLVSFQAADIVLGLQVSSNLLDLVKLEVPIVVETGGGSGYLASASCALGTNNSARFGVRLDPNVASVSTGRIRDDGGIEIAGINAEVLGALKDVLLSITVKATIDRLEVGSTESQDVFFDPYELHEGSAQSSTIDSDLGIQIVMEQVEDVLEVDVNKSDDCGLLGLGCLLGDILEPILDGAADTLNEILESRLLEFVGDLLNALLAPLLDALGLHLGGMTVSLQSASQGSVILLDCRDDICEAI